MTYMIGFWFVRRAALGVTLSVLALAWANPAYSQTPTVIYSFGEASPYGGAIAQGRDGNFYSTAPSICGDSGCDVVYQLTPSGVYTEIKTFPLIGESDGYECANGVTLGTDGIFYGTCLYGGANGLGTAFSLSSTGTFTLLHSFAGGSNDGSIPSGPLMQATDGNFYGVTDTGGTNDVGTIYRMTPQGTVTVLHSFGQDSAGYSPEGPLFQGSDGNLYGTTTNDTVYGCGTVYRSTLAGQYALYLGFNEIGACQPAASGLIQAANGNLYGTSEYGGAGGGTVYKMTSTGIFTLLHSFSTQDIAYYPENGVTQGTDGNFYGLATTCISFFNCYHLGSLFKINSTGTFTILYNFDSAHGVSPNSHLFQSTNGSFYGTTSQGGAYNLGAFFRFDEGLAPFVILQSTSGKVGTVVSVLGQGFNGATRVAFGGNAAAFTILSDTYLTAIVSGAALTGSLTVTEPGATLVSSQPFKVTPQILKFSPTSGHVGTSVTIAGSALGQTTSVKFNGVATSFTVNSNNQVTATVPSGATTGTIAIVTAGGTAISTQVFTVN